MKNTKTSKLLLTPITIIHKCKGEIVSNECIRKVIHHREFDRLLISWIEWDQTIYIVTKCCKCGRKHNLPDYKIIGLPELIESLYDTRNT